MRLGSFCGHEIEVPTLCSAYSPVVGRDRRVVQVEVDPVAGRLILTYDSQRLVAGEAERLARTLAAALAERPVY